VILDLWKKGYEGHIRQYTEAKTVDVPMAREGMYYRDFSVPPRNSFMWIMRGTAYVRGMRRIMGPALLRR
jgi:hypothetical protein